ncbi:MAG: pentapeptide repeat-containing protein [Spirochaetales bacterium]|nr:pentapeptide repeat-containing protein [Spirochaetales bacterium]
MTGSMRYSFLMFTVRRCARHGCVAPAFMDHDVCFTHLEDRNAALASLKAALLPETLVMNLCFDGLELLASDFSRCRFVGCTFRGVHLNHVLFTGSSFRLCFFDGSVFSSCDFSGCDMDFCSFGNSNIIDCSFENGEYIHVNFNGCNISEVTFTGSNLYDSRFLKTRLAYVHFDNCDLKKAYFIPDHEEATTYAGSNSAEAVRDMEHLYL